VTVTNVVVLKYDCLGFWRVVNMKIYRLRTVYNTTNLGFSDEGPLVDGIVKARLVQRCELLIATTKITGVNREGKKNIEVNIDTRVFPGHPLLLELTTTKETSDSVYPYDVRHELESRTCELAAVLAWSLQGVVGIMLGDELCSRKHFGFPSEWVLDDVVPLELTDYFRDIATVASRIHNTDYELHNHMDSQSSTVIKAIRWWYRARNMHSAIDSFLAYCIIIEMISSDISDEESISRRIEKTIATVFPELAQTNGCQSAKKMGEIVYKARCKCVHSGRSKISYHQPVYQFATVIAHACIKFMLNGSVSEFPEHILKTL
jgi:hypothetical protein